MNEKNLIQNIQRTPSERRESARKAGIASGEARRRKADMRNSMQNLLSMKITPSLAKQLQSLGIVGEEWTYSDLINVSAMQQAMKGNVRAMEFVRDTAGYNAELLLHEQEFEYKKAQESGTGTEIEDIQETVVEIWGYEAWELILADGVPTTLIQTVGFHFGSKHIDYIRKCHNSLYNIAEGAVRAGKTVDNVLSFAFELCQTKDKFHLATGSTMANAKLNIGDANGFGLEHIFRGQCKWSKYKDNDCMIIRGPYTGFTEKIVIFAGGKSSDSYKKIRGNSYGMWIATEINLHHDNTIKEAMNRQLAADMIKIFWDLNPEHPKAPIYVQYLDKWMEKNEKGELIGGYNYEHFTIFDNENISEERFKEVISRYEPGSIWYIRDIEGKRSIAEGLIYHKIATSIAAKDNLFLMKKKAVKELIKQGEVIKINVGVDFGGNGSGHAFVATAVTTNYNLIIFLRSERHLGDDIDPDVLGNLFIKFIKAVLDDYGFITRVYADSAEQVLMRGLRNALVRNLMGDIKIANALKSKITNRIFLTTAMAAQGRLFFTEDTETYQEAVSMAVWDSTKIELIRLDDGSSDIDTLDASEYTIERDYKKYLDVIPGGEEKT